MLEIKFVVEKKRVNNRSLLDFAAEAIAQQINVEWIRSYWNFKAELENANSEIDEEEIAAKVEKADELPTEGEVVHVEEDATIATNEGEIVHVEEDSTIVINEEVQHNIDDKDVNDKQSEDQHNEEYEPDDKIEDSTDTLEIASPDLPTADYDGFDFVSGWGTLYIFMVIFAYLCI